MKDAELTDRLSLARSPAMQSQFLGRPALTGRGRYAVLAVVGGAMMTAGCVSVNAPDKPIVIELNINIKQEVIYRLAQDAGNTIDKNPEIF